MVDVNGDDQDDLVIGEQYYRPTDNQTGVVTALYSRRTYKGTESKILQSYFPCVTMDYFPICHLVEQEE